MKVPVRAPLRAVAPAGSGLARAVAGQWAACLALVVLAATGTAYAVAPVHVAPRNSVTSASIKDGQVRAVDLDKAAVAGDRLHSGAVADRQVEDGSLRGGDVRKRSLGAADLGAQALTRIEIGGLTGADLGLDSLTGVNIAEQTLGTVTSAVQGGLGRTTGPGTCDPESDTFVDCGAIIFPLYTPGRLMLLATATPAIEAFADRTFGGACVLSVDGGVLIYSLVQMRDHNVSANSTPVQDPTQLMAVTDVLASGDHEIKIQCNQDGAAGAVTFRTRITALTLSGA